MDIKIEKKKYLVPRKYWAWIGGGAVLIAVLIWLGLSNFSSTLKVDRKGLSIGTVEKAQFNDYVSVDGQVVPISVVQISSEEGGIVLEKVVDEGAHVNKGDVIVKLSNSNLREQGRCDRETEQFESRPGDSECRKRTCRKAGHASQHPDFDGTGPSEQ